MYIGAEWVGKFLQKHGGRVYKKERKNRSKIKINGFSGKGHSFA